MVDLTYVICYYILYNYTAHLWASADQQGTDTFHNCEANYIQHLPSSLVCHLKFSLIKFNVIDLSTHSWLLDVTIVCKIRQSIPYLYVF